MPEVTYRNSDFVLLLHDDAPEVMDVVHKYDSFLSTLCRSEYAFQKDAINAVIKFLFSKKYQNTADLARENYDQNSKLKQKFTSTADYLAKFPLQTKKACSLDLATGTGKSFVIYALAQICLAEGLVDKVLVLCPSLTIEEGLKSKFEKLAGDHTLKRIIEEIGAVHKNPSIKSSNDPILEGDICVENIHATYERTGSITSSAPPTTSSRNGSISCGMMILGSGILSIFPEHHTSATNIFMTFYSVFLSGTRSSEA
jgi:type III restriction enzyme